MIGQHRERLQRHNELWGLVGYGLLQINDLRGCVQWLKDWPTREGVKAWMLVNIADALRSLGRGDEATAINEHAVRLPPDHGSVHHELWLAFESALLGNVEQARALTAHIEAAALDNYLSVLCRLLGVVMEAQQPATNGSAKAARQTIRALLKGNPWVRDDAAIKPAIKRAVALLAKRHRSIATHFCRLDVWIQLTFGIAK